MSWIRSSAPFGLLIILGVWVLFFSVWGIIFEKDWMIHILGAYGILLILAIVFIIVRSRKSTQTIDSMEEFEKSLKGGLYHFKCPHCNGIFALKKSRRNDRKPVRMTCPDCGEIATIPPNPMYIWDEIPEKKSMKANFRCNVCGEGLTVWAEGTTLYENMSVCSCPYCGEQKALNHI